MAADESQLQIIKKQKYWTVATTDTFHGYDLFKSNQFAT